MSDVRPLRIGVVGYGSIGRHHVRNLRAMDGVDFVGVADASPFALSQADAQGCATFPTCKALLDAGLDAAVISVPTSLHEEVAEEFIDRSCALLIEKPIAQSMVAAKRLIARCESAGIPLMVGYVERYNPAMEVVRDFVAEGNLGRLVSMSARRVGLLPPRIRDSSVLIDIGVHDIDMVAFITGVRLNLVAAQGGMAVLDDRLDYATLLLDAGGCVVSIEANWVTPVKLRELSITGTRGYCRVDYILQEAWFAPGRTFQPTTDYEDLVAQYSQGTLISLPVQKREPLARELEVFVNGVRGGPLPNPSIALASLRIAEEATEMIDRTARTLQGQTGS
ncbi:MAG: Gfo/Idh/MocA family oxidoreductase [Candidatus Eremiobacteraeota bacterium]|nr:Gfo/Idh/MocA family oxidoreductase [Candidatus Eremiobacteraeota bacterium]